MNIFYITNLFSIMDTLTGIETNIAIVSLSLFIIIVQFLIIIKQARAFKTEREEMRKVTKNLAVEMSKSVTATSDLILHIQKINEKIDNISK